MTEPTVPRPAPGPYRPVPRPAPIAAPDPSSGPGAAPDATSTPVDAPAAGVDARTPRTDAGDASRPDGAQEEGVDARRGLSGLAELPVAEHVAVFEAEHARLQRELGTIDPR